MQRWTLKVGCSKVKVESSMLNAEC